MEPDVATQTVHQRGGFDSEEQARETIHATLEALSHSVSRGDAERVAQDLPIEFADHMLVSEQEETEPMGYEAFMDRISDETGMDRAHVEKRVQAVMAAIEEMVDDFAFDALREQLPREYDPIFETEAVEPAERIAARLVASHEMDGDDARAVTEDVLKLLGRRLTRGEAERVAAHLPEEESAWLMEGATDEAEDWDFEEFVARLAEREGVDEDEAEKRARAVGSGLKRAMPDDEIDRARNQLAPDYSHLFR